MKKNFISEPARQLPIWGNSQILVIGGGFAGIAAAVSAARQGKTVTLIEKSILLGGLGTSGHVCIYLPLCDGLGHKIYGGLAEELLYVTTKYGYNTLPEDWSYGKMKASVSSGRYQSHFNIPACVMAFDELLEQHKVNVIFDTVFCEGLMDGTRCLGAVVENKSGRGAYLADMIVDASGDADVMYHAGAACIEQKSIVSHWTYELDKDTLKQGLASGKMVDAFALRWIGLRPDADNSKSELPRFYGTTSDGVNDYVKFSRKLALDFLKEHQGDDYTMLTLPTMPQFRTTRRIAGLKKFETIPGVSIDDSVGCVINCLQDPAAVYEFPYGAIIDKTVSNVLAAGRIVAAEGEGWEIMRYIPGCVFTGQVAGTAAAMALDNDCCVQEINVKKLADTLAETGVMIHMKDSLRENSGKPAYSDPTKKFDPHIRNENLAYAPH